MQCWFEQQCNVVSWVQVGRVGLVVTLGCCSLLWNRFLWINHSDHFLRINHFYGTQSLQSFPTDQLSHSDNFFGLVRFVRACWVPFYLKKISSRGKEWGEAKESSRIWSLYSRLASIHNVFKCLGCIEVKTHLWCSSQPGTAKWPWISSKVCSTWHQWFSAIQPVQFSSLQ